MPGELRQGLIDAGRRMNASGINRGHAGNLSVRVADGFLITPTGMAYEDLLVEDIVLMAADGSLAEGQRKPSSEWFFHRDIYRARADAGAIVHLHSPYATALACTRRSIPAFHYMIAEAGGVDIRCAAYATFGTQALADAAVAALAGRQACLLANHGQIALGPDIDRALEMAHAVEDLARQYCLTLQIGGPVSLDDAEMERILKKFEDYGRQE